MKEYIPHEYQRQFHRSPARFRTLIAGRRGGKSIAGTIEALWHADRTPNGLGLIVSPTYQMLRDINIPMLLDWIPQSAIESFNKVENRIRLINGFEIILRSGDAPDKVGRGLKLNWAWFDEASFFRYGRQVWEQVYPALTDLNAPAWITTTPQGYDWVYELLYKPAQQGNKEYAAWQYSTIDNPYIKAEIVDKARHELSEQMFRQEYMATFEKFVGLVYPDFDHKKHVIAPRKFQADDLWFVGIDVGFTNPTAMILMVEDFDKNVYIVDEVYQTGKTVPELAVMYNDMINRASQYVADGRPIRLEEVIIDPASQGAHQTSGQSVYTQFAEQGIHAVPGNNDVRAGIDKVTEYIRGEHPKLYVFNTCSNIIKEFENYSWKKHNADTSNKDERPDKAFDHALDAMRYVIMNRPDWYDRPEKNRYGQIIEDEPDDFFNAPEEFTI